MAFETMHVDVEGPILWITLGPTALILFLWWRTKQ